MSYDEKLLDIKTKFLIALKRNLLIRPNIKVDQDEIRRVVYNFVFSQIIEKIEDKKNIDQYCWELLYRSVDFCLSYGSVILDTLDEIKKRYQDSKMNEKESELIDA